MYIPVITIDGPSASGKGTVAALVAERLGFCYLDSGAIYRVCAFAAQRQGVALDDEAGLANLAKHLPLSFVQNDPYINDEPVANIIRSEEIGMAASKIAALSIVRKALLQRQRDFRQRPGLVADGRDMGTVVFPDATLKIFLLASVAERAKRRYKQLIKKGESANLARIEADIALRDFKDTNRVESPLKAANEAKTLDTTGIGIEQVVDSVLFYYRLAEKDF